MQAGAVEAVGEPAQRHLEEHVAEQDHRRHERGDAHRVAVAGGIHREERQHHAVEEGEEQHAHAQRRRYPQEAGEGEATRLLDVLVDTVIGHGEGHGGQGDQMPGADQQHHPRRLRAEQRHQGRAEQLEGGEAGGVQRHDGAAVVLAAQLVDPGLAEDDRDAHADPQRQARGGQRPEGMAAEFDGDGAGGAQHEAQQIQAAPTHQLAGTVDQGGGEDHAGRRYGGENADLQRAGAVVQQAQRHQRQGGAQAQADDGNGEQQHRQQGLVEGSRGIHGNLLLPGRSSGRACQCKRARRDTPVGAVEMRNDRREGARRPAQRPAGGEKVKAKSTLRRRFSTASTLRTRGGSRRRASEESAKRQNGVMVRVQRRR